MKTITETAAQGDVLFIRIGKLPDDLTETKDKKQVIVAHSETGHHHAIDLIDGSNVQHFTRNDPMICFLSVGEGQHADVVHHRSFDTHETLRLLSGIWEIRRQREHTPEGWRRVED